jgi:hypothetical protein
MVAPFLTAYPKCSNDGTPEVAAEGIFDGVEKGEEDIFPDPTSQTLADGWRAGVAKALERRINAVVLGGVRIDLRESKTIMIPIAAN